MNRIQKNILSKEKIATIILSVFYLFGTFFHLWEITKIPVVKLTELTLVVSNSIIIFYMTLINKVKRDFLLWVLITVIITLIIEIIGVHTGKVFGSYVYGDTMNFKILGVPIIIGVNWAILILASFEISRFFINSNFIRSFISGIIIVVFDFIMEPVAVELDYWRWANDRIPVQNYIIWFLLAVLFSFLLILLRVKTSLRILVVYFFLQLLFFLLLNIFLF